MAFVAYRQGNPRDPYERPVWPHHVHLANGCTDHTSAACREWHWMGSPPDPKSLYHVEVDVSTGLVAYTKLSDQEIADLDWLKAYEEEQQATDAAVVQAQVDRQAAALANLQQKALTDPTVALILDAFQTPVQAVDVPLPTPPAPIIKGVKKTK